MTSSSFSFPRHWWGKIIGGLIGLLRGGFSGAIIGALLGHLVDRFLAGLRDVGAAQRAFFDALFSTLGHLGKADGRVTEAEIRMAETLMHRMQISGEQRKRAIRLFNLGKQTDFDLDAALRPFVRHSATRHDLRRMFLEILVEAAFSSGEMTQAEHDVLSRVAGALRVPAQLFAAMLNARGAGGASRGGPRPVADTATLDQAYAHLGLKRSASDAEVKRAYRKLVGQYHPDKLIAHGLPEEMMELAKNRVREVNRAYDQIKQARGFK